MISCSGLFFLYYDELSTNFQNFQYFCFCAIKISKSNSRQSKNTLAFLGGTETIKLVFLDRMRFQSNKSIFQLKHNFGINGVKTWVQEQSSFGYCCSTSKHALSFISKCIKKYPLFLVVCLCRNFTPLAEISRKSCFFTFTWKWPRRVDTWISVGGHRESQS